MNSRKKTSVLFILLTVFAFQAPAQTSGTANQEKSDTVVFPQWAKDLRRWGIILFGSFPFTMLTVTFATDMHRWKNANGLDFSSEGRQYAPWPLKSAGAVAMENSEIRRTILLAAGLSAAVAVTDMIIVQAKRNKARKKAEALPVGTTIINRTPRPGEPAVQESAVEESAAEEPVVHESEEQQPEQEERGP